MTQEAAAAENADVNIDVTDTQVDQYFESGGEQAPEPEEVKTEIQEEKPEPQEEKPDRKVPYGALHEERMRRKELSEKMERMEERFSQVLERLQQPEQKAPDFDDDPVENLKYNQEQLSRQIQEQSKTLEEQRQAQYQQSQQQEVLSRYQADAHEFSIQQQDFQNAYKYLMIQRQQELQAIGYQPHEIQQIMGQEELGNAYKAFEDGVSPAQRIYELAKIRGYSASQPSEEEKKIDTLQKGIEASQSLSTGGGKSNDELSLEALADMEDEEFDQAWAKLIGS